MKPIRTARSLTALAALAALSVSTAACITGPDGVEGSSEVKDVPLDGTIFTIVFENEDANVVEEMPYLRSLAQDYASASAYYADHHPSLPNYLQLISGTDQDVADDEGPDVHQFDSENLASQLDDGGIPWRAYMEDMGSACGLEDRGKYAVRHNPFVYFTSVTKDKSYCKDHIVDMKKHLAKDLDADKHRYMWITPNECNDIHDCSPGVGDKWLQKIVPQLMASEGYKRGGAIFILFDEGGPDASYAFGGKQSIAAVVISDRLVSPGYVSDTLFSHDSYLATVQDTFGLERLPSTVDSTPMTEFFAAPEEDPPTTTAAP